MSVRATIDPSPAATQLGVCQIGKIRCYGHCLACGHGWASTGYGPPLCRCGLPQPAIRGRGNRRPGDCYIDLSWGGGQRPIYADENRRSFAQLAKLAGMDRMDRWRFAVGALMVIRSKLNLGEFLPTAFRRRVPPEWSFAGVALAWIADVESHPDVLLARAPGYLAQVRGYLRNHLEAFGQLDVRTIQVAEIQALHKRLKDEPSKRTRKRLKAKTVANVLGFVHSVLQVAFVEGKISKVPAFPTLSWSEPEYETYEAWETECVLEVTSKEDRPFFTLLAETPIRPSEARACSVGDLSVRGACLWIGNTWSRGKLKRRRKSGEGYWVPLQPRTLRLLTAMLEARVAARGGVPLDSDEFLFVTSPRQGRGQAGKPYTQHVSDTWRRYCERAGIRYRTLYALRHSWGRDAIDRGLSIEQIAAWMGHTQTRSTRRYAKASIEGLRESGKVVELFRQKVRKSTGKVQARG